MADAMTIRNRVREAVMAVSQVEGAARAIADGLYETPPHIVAAETVPGRGPSVPDPTSAVALDEARLRLSGVLQVGMLDLAQATAQLLAAAEMMDAAQVHYERGDLVAWLKEQERQEVGVGEHIDASDWVAGDNAA